MRYYKIFLLSILFVSCAEQAFEEKFAYVNSTKSDLYNQEIVDQCDTLSLEVVPSSYIGQLSFADNKFCFVDEKFCRIYNFTEDGKFINYNFNKGRSNSEIEGEAITGYVKMDNGNHFVLSSIMYSLYDTSYSRFKASVLNTRSDLMLSPSNPMVYTLSYDKFILKAHNNLVYYNVTLQHPNYNFIENPTECYENARNLFVYDTEKDTIVGMIGKYPEVYASSAHNQFSLINFDVSKKGSIYLSFEADEKIYMYDSLLKPTICFGVSGQEMDVSYPELITYGDFRANYLDHRQRYSFYKDILYLEPFDYVARIYARKTKDKDGLQIYNSEHNLIADLAIPKACKIAGANTEYLFLYQLDSDFERIQIYKIKL